MLSLNRIRKWFQEKQGHKMPKKNIKVQNHAIQMLKGLNKQREEQLLCDVVLIVEDQEFPTHQVVLSACSEYFQKMFSSKIHEQAIKDVPLTGVTATAVELVLDFLYTEEIELSFENVSEVLQAASLMGLADLLKVICDYFIETLNASNCLYLRELSKQYHLESLHKKTMKCILENFEKVSSQPMFFDLEKDEVAEIVASDDLKVQAEIFVFDVMVRWANKDPTLRKHQFPSLFKYIRLQHVPQELLASQIRVEPLVKQSHECRDVIEEIFHFHIDPSKFKPQKSRNWNAMFSLNQQGVVEQLVFTAERLQIKQIPEPDFEIFFTHTLTMNSGIVYLCGSLHYNNVITVNSFDGKNFKVEGDMKSSNVSEATAFCIGDFLYVVGCSEMSIVEVYQLCPSFKFVKTLHDQLDIPRNTSSVVLKGYAYVIGGSDRNQNYEYLRYGNRRTSRRFSVPSFKPPQFSVLSCVKVFDPTTETWSDSTQMIQPRERCGAAVLGSKIFVCGGFGNSGSHANSIEHTDVTSNAWILVPSNFPINFGPTSVCVVEKKLYIVGMDCNELWKYDSESDSLSQDQRYTDRPSGCKIFSLC